jgi:hypothetical protein
MPEVGMIVSQNSFNPGGLIEQAFPPTTRRILMTDLEGFLAHKSAAMGQ